MLVKTGKVWFVNVMKDGQEINALKAIVDHLRSAKMVF